jgi:hypothetical protein
MEIHRLEDVFGISRDVPKSYVVRENVDNRFLNDITRTKHIVLFGGSKQGKSCLRKHSLNPEDSIVIQCHREATKADVYEMLLKQAGIKVEVSDTKTLSGGVKLTAKIEAEGKIPLIAKGKAEGGGEASGEVANEKMMKTLELDPEDPNEVARVLNEINFEKFIVLEDFHYLEPDIQQAFAFDLKVFHEVSKFVFIIVGVWLEANRLTLYNGDVSGRITNINVDEWPEGSLREVITAGEVLLNIELSDDVVSAIVEGCQGNVGVLQETCYRVCEANSIWQTCEDRTIINDAEFVANALGQIAVDQAGRYRTFLGKFSEGLGVTDLEMYKWIAWAAITSKPHELRNGLAPNVIFQRIKQLHPNASSLQHNNVNQALERVSKVQHRHKLQPLIFDYSDGDLKVVDANFLVFLQTQSTEDLLAAIGMTEGGTET